MKIIKIAVPIVNGFEERELITAIDIWKRAGFEVDLISFNQQMLVTGDKNITIQTNAFFEKINFNDYQMIFIPGGDDVVAFLNNHPDFLKIIADFNTSHKYLSAISAATQVLGKAGVLNGKNVTVYPGCYNYLDHANIIDTKNVVIDKNIITAIGPVSAIDFSLAIVKIFTDSETVTIIEEEMLLNCKPQI